MQQKFTLKSILCGCLLMVPGVCVFAGPGMTRLEAFISREKQQHDFVPVTDFWQADPAASAQMAGEYVRKAAFLALDQAAAGRFLEERNRAVTFRVPGRDRVYDIALARYDHFTGDFKVQTVAGDVVTDFSYTHGLHYSGVIAGIPGSVAAFSFFNGMLYGIFSVPGEGNYVLAPNSLLDGEYGSSHYILYNDADLVNKNAPLCGTDQLPALKDMKQTAGAMARNAYTTCRDMTVYFQAAYATYLSFGSSTTQVVDYITFVHNVAATLYRNEGIYTSIKIIKVNTTPDEYQSQPATGPQASSLPFLNKFGEVTQNNLNGANVAVLLSTRGGGLGGVAWLNAMCTSYYAPQKSGPYAYCNITKSTSAAFPTYSWDAEMVTHEVGHLVGSPHTHSCTWPGGPIDGCWPVEGNCTRPSTLPANGGTIMSYCHNTSVGINFTNGFGPLPGNLIRNNMETVKTCVSPYLVNKPLATSATTLIANRECTDAGGITYYFNDNNNADKTDDRIVMKIRKNGNNIGTLDDFGFEVKAITTAGLGSGQGVRIMLPSGTPGLTDSAFAVRRYFTFKPVTQPTSAMEFMIPLHYLDTADLSGSVRRAFSWSDIRVYALDNTALNPNPSSGLNGVRPSDLDIYAYGTAASPSTWALDSYTADSAFFVQFSASRVTGGAVYVNAPFRASVAQAAGGDAVAVYPNPAKDYWSIRVPETEGNVPVTFTLYGADGRMMIRRQLQPGAVNIVPAATLTPGMYFFRMSGSTQVHTGMLEKR